MTNKIVGFKLIKVGRHFVSGTLSALAFGVALSATSASADTTTILSSGGSSTPGVQDQGSTATSSVGGYSTVDFVIQTPNIDALGIETRFNPDAGNQNNRNYSTINDNTITLNAGRNITGKTLADGISYVAIYSQNSLYESGDDNNYNYSYFGSGSSLNLAGNNSIDGQVGYNFTSWAGTSGQNDMLGTINLNGSDVRFGNAVLAENTNVNSGTNNTSNNDYSFYGTLYSNLNFNQAASVLLNGGLRSLTGNSNSDVGQSTSGALYFNGHNSIVTLGANQQIDGDISTTGVNGTLVFQGAGTLVGDVSTSVLTSLKEIRMNGAGTVGLQSTGASEIDYLNYQAAALVAATGGLNMNVDTSSTAKNQVAFNQHDGVLQIGNNASLIGVAGREVVTTTGNGTVGTVTMVSGTQTITGNIGSSGHAIKTLNIGGTDLSVGLESYTGEDYSNTTINGDVFAQNTVLNNDEEDLVNGIWSSSLAMASGFDLNSTVTTDDHNLGILTMLGGAQTVTGDVGTDTKRLGQVNSAADGATTHFGSSLAVTNVFAKVVTNTGSGTTNFSNNVTATDTLNVNAGTTNVANDTTVATINITTGTGNFTNNVTATTTNIGTGEGNFNTNGTGTTDSIIAFTDAGTANLHTGLTGNIAFAGNDATVNVWNLQTVDGDVTTNTNNTGILNFKGDGNHTGDIGAANMGIASLNVNTALEQNSTEGVLVDGNIFADSITLNGGALTVAVDKNLTDTGSGDFITTVPAFEAAGELRLLGGTQVVDGIVGTDEARLRFVNTSFSQSGTTTFTDTVYIDRLENGGYSGSQPIDGTVTLNGMAYISTLNMNTDGAEVNLNGTNASNADASGLVGQLALNNNSGVVNIGDDVDLTVINPLLTQDEGVFFSYAGNASLNFVGSSTVNGQVGGGEDYANSTFSTIHAGANGKTVTFKDDVYVIEGTPFNPATFHVSGTGTVNFEGDLNGDLVFDEDGVVKMSAGKSIKLSETATVLAATTGTGGEGTINFLGATTLASDLGEDEINLKAVNFNTENNNVTQSIASNIYADHVTIGNLSAEPTQKALTDVAGSFDFAGATQMSEFTQGQTIINVADGVTFGGDLTFANAETAMNVGTAHVDVLGDMTTNGSGLSFTVNTDDITDGDDADSTSNGSGRINLASSKSLTLSGSEQIHINYVGSLKDAGTYTLIDVDGTQGSSSYDEDESTYVTDNSFLVDTRVYQFSGGDLVVQAVRSGADYTADELYAHKSDTLGHFSNNAAAVLAGIAADGTQSGDMVQVIQKIELDAYGYGNNAENLATQVKRLAPVANDAMTQAALSVSALPARTVESRMSMLRATASGLNAGDAFQEKAAWVKLLGSTGEQDSTGDYDGYKYASTGIMVGADLQVNPQLLVGGALSHTRTDIDQTDFRTGDSTDLEATHLTAYGAYALDEKIYLEGSLSFGWLGYEGHRQTAIDRVAHSDFSGDQLGLNLTAGYRIPLSGKQLVTPMVKLDYSRVKNEVYSETGADALNLVNVTEPSLERTRLGLGVKYQNEWVYKNTTYLPEVSLSYSSALGSQDDKAVSASYQGGGESFLTPVALADEDALNLSAGFSVQADDNKTLNLRYDLESRDGFLGQGAELTLRVVF